MNSFFEIIRAGINTTFQDNGRNNLYHIGIPFSGAMDKRNYFLANSLVGNKTDKPVIEFAYQGPLIKHKGIINVGGPIRTVYQFAKKSNPKIKKIQSKQIKGVLFKKKMSMNISKFRKIYKKKI